MTNAMLFLVPCSLCLRLPPSADHVKGPSFVSAPGAGKGEGGSWQAENKGWGTKK
jgi:hypothetical protein